MSRRGCFTVIGLVILIVILINAVNPRERAAVLPTSAQLPTLSPTPAATATEGPSPTITDTPIPSETPVPSATPTQPPTETPVVGTRGNPYPVGQAGAIRDGRFQVNTMRRAQNDAVHQMNMFNAEPDAGKEWVLASVTFYCDLTPDETCNTSLMRLEAAGDLGEIYSQPFGAVIENELSGEVFGGGSKTGVIAFIINSADKNISIAVNDLGKRVFFRAE